MFQKQSRTNTYVLSPVADVLSFASQDPGIPLPQVENMPSPGGNAGDTDNEEATSPILSHKHATVVAEAPHTVKGPARLWVSFAQKTRLKDSPEDAQAPFESFRSSSPNSANLDVSIYPIQR